MHKEITNCRICGNKNLVPVLNLGRQYLTGIFPETKNSSLPSGPLEIVKCHNDMDNNKNRYCNLLQLKHSYDLDKLYGANYGYRSSLNKTMIMHLRSKIRNIISFANLENGDLIIDIGSNDGTLLGAYPKKRFKLVGIDPTADKFKNFYPPSVEIIPDFFSSKIVKKKFGNQKAKVITSIAMFYDLEFPMDFMQQIYDILDDNGIWVFEQSYMPKMLEICAYDTICHEHLEYYGFKQIKWMTDRIGFKIVNIEFNDINGGSFSVTVSKKKSNYKEAVEEINIILSKEKKANLDDVETYSRFEKKVYEHKKNLNTFLQHIKSKGKKILGYGASTKGNVILQFCNITPENIPFIAEVNSDKFGCYTPGTNISIISEYEARTMKPDYFMVLPWHFRESIISRETSYLKSGGRLFFPLPQLEVIEG